MAVVESSATARNPQPSAALRAMLARAAQALAFILDDSEGQVHSDRGVRVRANASRCGEGPAVAAIDTAFPACAFLVGPWRVLTAGHAVCFRHPRKLKLLFAHAAAPVDEADGSWFRFAAEQVASVDHVEFLDFRPGHADVALLRLKPGPWRQRAHVVPLAQDAVSPESAEVGMVAHPHGRPCQTLCRDPAGNAARIVAADAQTLTARLTAWRGCSGAPWCTASGVVGVQVRTHAGLAYAQRGLVELVRRAAPAR